jgi:hypothetical protein
VPEDNLRLPRFAPAALSPEVRALLKSQLPSPGQLWPPALKAQLAGLRSPELQATLLPPALWPPSVIEFKQRQLVERCQAIEALERERDAIERKIGSERQAARSIEAELARAGGTPDPPGVSASTAATLPPAPSLTVEHSSGRPLVQRFLDANPMSGASAARIREAMGGRGEGSARPSRNLGSRTKRRDLAASLTSRAKARSSAS